MKLLLLFISLCCLSGNITAQTDSVTAYYLRSLVDRIENRLDADVEMSADTVITDEKGSITVHTGYYIDPGSGQVEKIFEKTLFGEVSTEITVYYRGGSPILFQTKQWQGSKLAVDFDYYYQTDNPVYFVKREFSKGNPDPDQVLKWCYQLVKESRNNKLLKNDDEPELQERNHEPNKKATTSKKSIFPFFKKKKH